MVARGQTDEELLSQWPAVSNGDGTGTYTGVPSGQPLQYGIPAGEMPTQSRGGIAGAISELNSDEPAYNPGNASTPATGTPRELAYGRDAMWRILEQQNGLPYGSMGYSDPIQEGWITEGSDEAAELTAFNRLPQTIGPGGGPTNTKFPTRAATPQIVTDRNPPLPQPTEPDPSILRGQRLARGNSALDALLSTDYIPQGYGSDLVSSLISRQRDTPEDYLDNLFARGLINEGGKTRGYADIDRQEVGARSRVSELLGSTLEGGRQQIRNRIGTERSSLPSSVETNEYDSTGVSRAISELAGSFLSSVGPTLDSGFPNNGLFDVSGLGGISGAPNQSGAASGNIFAGTGNSGAPNDPDDTEEDDTSQNVLF